MSVEAKAEPLPARLRNSKTIQNSWVVTDIEAAVRDWVCATDVGPFFVVKGVTLGGQSYRDTPAAKSTDVTFALAQAGDTHIELVCQHNEVKSADRDLVPAGRSGFHHTALGSHYYDANLADYMRTGFEVAFSGAVDGKQFCFVDMNPSIG